MVEFKKIKILHIITRLDPGGSSTNTIETVARLNKDKYEVFLISGRTKEKKESTIQTLNQKAFGFYLLMN